MKKLLLLLIATAANAVTLPLYIETDTNTVVSPDAPTTLAGYGITDGGLPTSTGADYFLFGDGVDGWTQGAGSTAQISLGIVTTDGGGAVGVDSDSTFGGAIGNFSSSTTGGAAGYGATTITGGAVGYGAFTKTGGAIGNSAVASNDGGAVGDGARTSFGGGAIGSGSSSSNGFAGGVNAVANQLNSVQLGSGTNGTDSTIQFLSSGSVTAAEFGQLASNVTTITATTYTALVTDGAILANNAAGVTITLPAAASVPSNYRLSIKNIGSSGEITINGDGAETIDGELSIILTTQYESVTLVTDGSNWFIL